MFLFQNRFISDLGNFSRIKSHHHREQVVVIQDSEKSLSLFSTKFLSKCDTANLSNFLSDSMKKTKILFFYLKKKKKKLKNVDLLTGNPNSLLRISLTMVRVLSSNLRATSRIVAA